MKLTIPVFALALLAACGGSAEQASDPTQAADSSAAATVTPIDLATHGLPLLLTPLDRDLLRKNTVLRETPEGLTYRSEFPDDPTLVFMHFYQVVKAGDRTFVVQDLEGQTFNQQDIDRMMAAISPKPPA